MSDFCRKLSIKLARPNQVLLISQIPKLLQKVKNTIGSGSVYIFLELNVKEQELYDSDGDGESIQERIQSLLVKSRHYSANVRKGMR